MKKGTFTLKLWHFIALIVIWLFSWTVFAHVINFYDRDWTHDDDNWPNRANNFIVNIWWKSYNLVDHCDDVKYKNGFLYCKQGNRWDFGAFIDTKDLGITPNGEFPSEINVEVSENGSAYNRDTYVDTSPLSYISNSARKLNGIFAEDYLNIEQYNEAKNNLENIVNRLKSEYTLNSDLGDISLLKKNTLLDPRWKILLGDVVNYDLIDLDIENVKTICNTGCDFNLHGSSDITRGLNSALEMARRWLVKNIKIKPFIDNEWNRHTYTVSAPITIKGEDIMVYADSNDQVEIIGQNWTNVFEISGNNNTIKNIRINTWVSNAEHTTTWILFKNVRWNIINEVTINGEEHTRWIVMEGEKCVPPTWNQDENYCNKRKEANYLAIKDAPNNDEEKGNIIINSKIQLVDNAFSMIVKEQNKFLIKNNLISGKVKMVFNNNGIFQENILSGGHRNDNEYWLWLANNNSNIQFIGNNFTNYWANAFLISADENDILGIANNKMENILIKDNNFISAINGLTVFNGDYTEWKTKYADFSSEPIDIIMNNSKITTATGLEIKNLHILQNVFNLITFNALKIDSSLTAKNIQNLKIIQNMVDMHWMISSDWQLRTPVFITDREFIDENAESTLPWMEIYKNRLLWKAPTIDEETLKTMYLWWVYYFRPYHWWDDCFCNAYKTNTKREWFPNITEENFSFEDRYCTGTDGVFKPLTCAVPDASLLVDDGVLDTIMWI